VRRPRIRVAEFLDSASADGRRAEALAARLYAALPRIRITDLLTEAAGCTLFPDCFTHLRTGECVADSRILMAGLLADGLNLGLTRMAEACSFATIGQLSWTSDWHIREEIYALALQCLINQQQREPFAAMFGNGDASSSDGQFFQAGGFSRDAGRRNAHYGHKPGFTVYTHISDRYAPFYSKLIASTASEALHVLDALLYHQSDVATRPTILMAVATPIMSSRSAHCWASSSRRAFQISRASRWRTPTIAMNGAPTAS